MTADDLFFFFFFSFRICESLCLTLLQDVLLRSLSLSPFFTSNLTIEFIVLHDEFDEGESMPSAGGSIEGKNSVPIVREAVPLARLPAGPTMFLERQDYRSTRRVIYESSVLGGRALCSSSSRAPRRRRSRSSCFDIFATNNAASFCVRAIAIS